MDIRKKLINGLGLNKKYFVDKLMENQIGVIKLAFVREVINPMIIRNNAANEVNTFNAPDGRELIEIPARKLKSKEKRLGLMICRNMKVVNDGVRYNSIFDIAHLANPNSVLFGDSVTQSDGGALVSRVVYDWAYSLRDVDTRTEVITKELQHNSLSEDGTIIKDRDVNTKANSSGTKVASQSLHSVKYVMPGTLFPHFVTIDNTTPELLVHLLFCILNEHKYGAQSTTMGSNMNNHLIGIAFSDFEKPINSYTISRDWYTKQNTVSEDLKEDATVANLTTFMQSELTKHYTQKGLVDNIEQVVTWINTFWSDDKDKKVAYEQAQIIAKEYLKDLKMTK